MAVATLARPQARLRYFQQGILTNLGYWQGWLESRLSDMAALERERQNIVRAISFAVDLDEGWGPVYQLIMTFSPYMERSGHWESWNRVLSLAIRSAQRLEDSDNEVALSMLLARLLFQQSQFRASVRSYRRTMQLARRHNDRYNEARCYTNLGYYYIERGLWQRAEVLCCRALAIFERLDNAHGLAHTENHLGILCSWQQPRWAEAGRHLERACAIWRRMGDDHGLLRGELNLAGLYIRMAQPEAALGQLEKSLVLAGKIKDEIIVGRIYFNFGMAYRLQGDFSQAERYLKQAESIFRQRSNLAELTRVWVDMGLVCFGRDHNYGAAMTYLENALQGWRNLANKIEEIEVLLDITEIELACGHKVVVGARLDEIDRLLAGDETSRRFRHFRPRLVACRRSLVEE